MDHDIYTEMMQLLKEAEEALRSGDRARAWTAIMRATALTRTSQYREPDLKHGDDLEGCPSKE